MHPLFRIFSFFTLLILSILFLGSGEKCYAGVPVFNDITKWKAAPTTSVAPHKTKPTSRSVSTTTSVSRGGAPIILGRSNSINQVKKRKGPVVTAATTRRLNRKISSRAAIIIDAITGKTLYSRNPDSRRQPASTIKVLTGMIALKSLSKGDQVSISRKAARQPRSKIYLDQKKHYKATDLINAVLLASANDASVALAERIAGDEKSFAKMMTLRAQLWGAKNTVCKTATGLTAKGQKSTARDLATIFRHAMSDPEFSSRMKTIKTRTSGGKLLRNHNKALWQVKGALGGKTGYTNAARQTYVGKFKRGKEEIIVAIMGSETMWSDIKRLVSYGFLLKMVESDTIEFTDEDIELVSDMQEHVNEHYSAATP